MLGTAIRSLYFEAAAVVVYSSIIKYDRDCFYFLFQPFLPDRRRNLEEEYVTQRTVGILLKTVRVDIISRVTKNHYHVLKPIMERRRKRTITPMF